MNRRNRLNNKQQSWARTEATMGIMTMAYLTATSQSTEGKVTASKPCQTQVQSNNPPPLITQTPPSKITTATCTTTITATTATPVQMRPPPVLLALNNRDQYQRVMAAAQALPLRTTFSRCMNNNIVNYLIEILVQIYRMIRSISPVIWLIRHAKQKLTKVSKVSLFS